MSSTFTVTVDVSKIKEVPPFIYHVFVDPSRMSVFIEFIELIRSMFRIKEFIRFTHGTGYIHFLEDIRILSVLQKVQAEVYIPEESERERMQLLLQTMKFYDKSQNIPKILLNRLRINFDNQTGEILDKDNERIQDISCEEKHQTPSQNELNASIRLNGSKTKEITSQIQLLAIEQKNPSDSVSYKPDNNRTVAQHSESPKHMNISEVDNIIPNQKKKSNFRRPFSLGAMLTELRKEASATNIFPDEEKLNNSNENSQDDESNLNYTVENEQDGGDDEDTSNNESLNKKRKRVRKHRSRKRKQNENIFPNPISTPTPSETFENSEEFVPRKMRHVRFANNDTNENPNEENHVQVNLTVDQIYQELEQKKELLKNGLEEEATTNNYEKIKKEVSCVVAVNNEVENKTDNEHLTPVPLELNELFAFRKKNLSPVVYKRTNDLISK